MPSEYLSGWHLCLVYFLYFVAGDIYNTVFDILKTFIKVIPFRFFVSAIQPSVKTTNIFILYNSLFHHFWIDRSLLRIYYFPSRLHQNGVG